MIRFLLLVSLFFRPATLDFASGLAGLFSGIQGMNTAGDLPEAPDNLYNSGAAANENYWNSLNRFQQLMGRNMEMTDPNLVNNYQALMGMDLSTLGNAGDEAGRQLNALSWRARDYGAESQRRAGQDFSHQDILRNASGGMRSKATTLWDQRAGIMAQADPLRGAGQAAYLASLDPRGELRDRMRQQTVEGSRAADSARGLAMGAQSANLENQALRDFNIDWENQQLGRQLAGLGGYNSASDAANRVVGVGNDVGNLANQLASVANQTDSVGNQSGAQGAQNLQNSMGYYAAQPGFTTASAQVPIQMRSQQYTMPMQWTNMFNQAQGLQNAPLQQNIQNMANYTAAAQAGQNQNWQNTTNYLMNYGGLRNGSFFGLAGGGGAGPWGNGGAGPSGFGNPANWLGMGGMGAGSGVSPGGMQM